MPITEESAREAVAKLGLLKAEAVSTIVALLNDDMAQHPRAICTAYRKSGAQIDLAGKRSLGIRANAFLSESAFEELTGKGRLQPLEAHELTLLRATFSVLRHRRIEEGEKLRAQVGKAFLGYVYDVLTTDCAVCKVLGGVIVAASQAAILPPAGCTCVTANYGLSPKIDWLADVE